jgi:hypothetical protein
MLISCWQGREGLWGKKIQFKFSKEKLICTRVIPGLILIGIVYFNSAIVMDYADPHIIVSEGVLKSISYSSLRPYHYSIKIDGKTYRVPKKVQNYKYLKKGVEYKVLYFSHSKFVVSMRTLDSEQT